MLLLLKEGKEWVESKDVVAAMQRGGVPSSRVVWNRGKTRLIEDHGRLEVRPELDQRHRPIALYRLRFVEGRTFRISIEHYAQLPEDLRRFYRPVEPRVPGPPAKSGPRAFGELFDGLQQASLETMETARIEQEILRRESQDPEVLVSPFARNFSGIPREMERLRPISRALIRKLLKRQPKIWQPPPGFQDHSDEAILGGSAGSPKTSSGKTRTASHRPRDREPAQ